MEHVAVIMAGGKGTRLWPLSTAERPKQFLPLLGDDTMIQCTVKRIAKSIKHENIFIVTSEKYRELSMSQLPELPSENILCEPVGKNTAPCIAMVTREVIKRFGDAIITVLASDHSINDTEEFIKTIKKAWTYAEKDNIVTLGIPPAYPEIGYGYIKIGKEIDPNKPAVAVVDRFVEKPNLETAQQYLQSGDYVWNSGMFVWKNSVIYKCFQDFAPTIAQYIDGEIDFMDMPSVSIDVAVMEKAANILVIKSTFDWDDIGGWQPLLDNKNYRELTFGTGGMRALIGDGTNRMNIYTVKRATLGIVKYLKATNPDSKKVLSAAVCYDNRNSSDLFAQIVADTFAENGIKTYITPELAPTPFLSFCVRELKCDVGVMITASHNPKEYNGYKVYNSAGCQVTDNAAGEISKHIRESYTWDEKAQTASEKVEKVPKPVYEKYVDATIKERVGEKFTDGFGVAYTPLHGAGARFILEVLQKVGVKNVHTVESQMTPDPEFTNCKNPNPEKPASMEMVIDLAKKTGSALAFATDPDADRIGVAVLHNNEYSLLTGNEVAVLLSDYLLSKSELKNPIIIKTIVTTVLIDKIAAKYGAQVINTLTGFKYIGEQMDRIEDFLFGCEESYGYLKGTHVRDKDAIVACMLICEMAMHYKEKGKTLVDALNGIYAEHGHCTHKLLTYEFKGLQGEIEKQKLLTEFRTNPPTKFASVPVVSTIDYLNQTEKDLPKSDILEYNLANTSSQYQIIIRPSGTEPLIKVYIAAIGDLQDNKDFIDTVTKEMNVLFKSSK